MSHFGCAAGGRLRARDGNAEYPQYLTFFKSSFSCEVLEIFRKFLLSLFDDIFKRGDELACKSAIRLPLLVGEKLEIERVELSQENAGRIPSDTRLFRRKEAPFYGRFPHRARGYTAS